MLQPVKGRVFDPAMGSGGFFVQIEEFIEEHGGKVANGKTGQISVYGQKSNPATWRRAAMTMAIRGIDFKFGSGPADTLLNDQQPDLRADLGDGRGRRRTVLASFASGRCLRSARRQRNLGSTSGKNSGAGSASQRLGRQARRPGRRAKARGKKLFDSGAKARLYQAVKDARWRTSSAWI